MATTMLSLIQSVRGELGLIVPTAVASSQDTDIKTTLALMNAAGQELVNMKAGGEPWNKLVVEYRFTTQYQTLTGTCTIGSPVVTGISSTTGLDTTYMAVGTTPQDTYILSVDSPTQVTLSQNCTAGGSQTINFCKTQYTLPSDYKMMVGRTQWDKSKHWEMLGPLDGQQWQWLKSGYISTGPRVRFRLLNGLFQTWPALTTNEYLGYEYLSNGWATSNTGTRQTSFLADTDTCIFSDRLMIIGSKLKYFQLKQFDTSSLMADMQRELNIEIANDEPQPILSYAPRTSEILIGYDNIPDSGYGS